MTTFQKIVKYLAIAFGIYLSLMIFSAIISIATSILGVTTIVGALDDDNIERTSFAQEYSGITELDIDINSGNLIIETGPTFKVELKEVSKYVTVESNQGKLKIQENSKKALKNNIGQIIVYIPENTVLNEVEIDSGIGETEIKHLNAKECEMDFGVGSTKISNMTVQNKIKIETGTGEVSLDNCNVNNLSLETGVGKTEFVGNIEGSSSIKNGMGELDIDLLGKSEEYQIITETGIGEVKLNNQNIGEGTIGTGKNVIKVEGGIGSISIKTK